jgi:peptidoglycan hydrolase-like protein with peptidoglycan-binding domain
MSPQRADQIQEALVQAGDLREAPSGRWDAQTREAMKEYQQHNGFNPTGLPDAKSLMKMGLGPHPLPADVDPAVQAKPVLNSPRSASESNTRPSGGSR